MKRTSLKKTCQCVVLAVVVLSITTVVHTAYAQTPPYARTYVAKGPWAWANWSTPNIGDGCTSRSIDVFINSYSAFGSPSGTGQTGPTLNQYFGAVQDSRFNSCTGAFSFIVGDFTSDPSSTFQFAEDRQLTGARLTGTTSNVYVCGWDPATGQYNCDSSGTHQIAFDVQWTAIGTQFFGTNNYRYTSPNGMELGRTVGSQSDASVSGSILEDGTDVITAVNWTSSSGGLGNSISGFVSVIRPNR